MFELDAYNVRPDSSPRDVYHVRKEIESTISWTIRNGREPVDLVDKLGDTSSMSALCYVRELRTTEPKETWPGVLVSPETGLINVSVPKTTLGPGNFLCQLAIRDADENILLVDEGYIDIRGDVTRKSTQPLSIADVRMALYDLDPELNMLIDRLEFEDAQIAYCMQRPIDMWNETPPQVTIYTQATFPSREFWLRGTMGFLLRQISYLYTRNTLNYQAGGMSVNDQDRGKDYLTLANGLLGEYKEWMERTKTAQNLSQFYGTIDSGFNYRYEI